MKIILDLDGWKNEIEISDFLYSTGVVEIDFMPPPLLHVVPPNEKVREQHNMRVIFRDTGRHLNGKPIFKP